MTDRPAAPGLRPILSNATTVGNMPFKPFAGGPIGRYRITANLYLKTNSGLQEVGRLSSGGDL